MKEGDHEGEFLLPTLPPRPGQQRMAFAIALLLLVIFLVTTPFSSIQFPKSVAFVAGFQTILFVNDSITATVLFAHFSILRWRSLLVLASGYLFTSFIAIPYAVAFPGLIWRDGLGAQTAGWLYLVWHCGLPLAVIAYVTLNWANQERDTLGVSTTTAIGLSVAVVVAAVFASTWAAVAADTALPRLFLDAVHISLFGRIITAGLALLSAVAITLLWIRGKSALDLWLMVVLWAWLLECAFFVVVTALRFSLAYYTSRIYAVFTASIVLLVLLSEMTKLYASLAHVNASLQRERRNKLLNIDAVTSAIAHEIKQPLAAISANLMTALILLQRMPSIPQEVQDSLNDAESEVFRATDTLDGIRSLFAATGRPLQSVDINDIVLESLDSLRGALQDRGVTASRDFALNLPLITGHRGQLREVVLNLIHNALEAMEAVAGGDGKIEITTRHYDASAIVVAVKDTGPGIDPKKLEAIFDAFVTTKKSGMGLGLAICRTIVEQHGGRLIAHSDGKNGALFQFTLPIKPPNKGDIAAGGAAY